MFSTPQDQSVSRPAVPPRVADSPSPRAPGETSQYYARSLIEASLDPLVTISAEGTITDVNEASVQAVGVPREKLIGTDFSDYFTEPERAREGYRQVFSRGFVRDYPLAIRHTSGRIIDVLYNASVYKDDRGNVLGVFAAARDITARKRAEAELNRVNRALRAITACNQSIIHALDEDSMLNEVCHIIVGEGGYRMAWIGFAVDDPEKTVRPVAVAGNDDGYVANARVTWSDTARGRGPTGRAIRTGQPTICRDMVDDPAFAPWRDAAIARGFGSSIVVPLLHEGRAFGAMSIYAGEPGAFDAQEAKWLLEFGEDLAFGLMALRARAERRRAIAEIRRLNATLEQRVRERTAELMAVNHELEAFAYSVSHDLRAPLRSIDGFSRILLRDQAERLDEAGRENLTRIRAASQRMATLIDDLLQLSRTTRIELHRTTADVTAIANELAAEFAAADPARAVTWSIAPGLCAIADASLIRIVLQNLLGNAWKFTARQPDARIELGLRQVGAELAYFVHDNGVGFDMQYAGKLFGAFQRLHSSDEFPGTGIGLATVQRIVHRHGGRVWAESEVGHGATFFFTLPTPSIA